MEGASGEEGCSQEALRGPPGPASGHRTVLEKRSQQSSTSTLGVTLRAGTGERYRRIPDVVHRLVNGRWLRGAGGLKSRGVIHALPWHWS